MPLRDDGGIPIPVSRRPPPPPPPPTDVLGDLEVVKELSILRIEQSEDAWCYAACTAMIINTLRGLGTVEQCEIASFVKSGLLAEVDCCGGGDERCLDSGCTVDDFGFIFDNPKWAIAFTGSGGTSDPAGAASLSQLLDEYTAARPVLVRVEWHDVGAHALIVAGVDGAELQVIDPLDGSPYGGTRSYDDLVDGFGEGSWTETWMDLKKK